MRSAARPRRPLLVASLLVLTGVAPAARGATPEQVEAAVAKAKTFLYAQQHDGTWEDVPAPTEQRNPASVKGGQWGGQTAIATYALLAAGENPHDPRIEQAVAFLEKADVHGVYAVGMRAQVWNLLPKSARTKAGAARDCDLLLKAVSNAPASRGFYAYMVEPPGNYHHSPSQYGVLGVWACSQAGVEVPADYWAVVDEAWRGTQQFDGGWSYQFKPMPPRYPICASMTAAGVATLFITQDYLHGNSVHRNTPDTEAIEKGLAWMGAHFAEVRDPYTWYGAERIGVASGRKYFGASDWFAAGADWFVRNQTPPGSWMTMGLPVPGTAFGLLFLSRGSAPVVFNKLSYDVAGKEADWDQRPRDAANLVRWLGKVVERDLNWQIVSLKAPPEELHDAPILYLAGNQPLDFTAAEEAKLKQFVEEGGMILGNADAGAEPFAEGFRKLGAKLFPGYEFRELPADHVIYHEQFPRTKWASRPSVEGQSNGVRELMLLVPQADPSRAWQSQAAGPKPEAFELMADVFLYAVDKQNLSVKGRSYIVKPDASVKAMRTIKVARLKYDGNWDPEPGGWRRLAADAHNRARVDLDVEPVALGEGQLTRPPADAAPATRPSAKEIHQAAFKRIPPDQVMATAGDQDKLEALIAAKTADIEAELKAADAKRLAGLVRFKVAHLTGTAGLRLTPAQTAELKAFVEGGGTLVVDAAGGSGEFARSAEAAIKAAFGPSAGQLDSELKPDHPLYTLAGRKPDDVGYRDYARRSLGNNVKTPHLRGIDANGRTAVVFSREDLTAALVGEPVDGVTGYDPKTAAALMTNILLYAAPADKAGR